MFVHIGNNRIINTKDIICIYNISSMKKTKEYENLVKELKEKNRIIDISNKEEKTLIITEEEKQMKGYISNISSVTLGKRVEQFKNK